MPTVDLQIHTNATPHHSTWTPDALVEAALQRRMVAIAATDHNTTASVGALQQAGERVGLPIISGVEIDSAWNGKLWHTLVYGAPPDAPELLALCQNVFSSNANDAQRLIETLPNQGFVLPDLDALDRQPNVADVATALARHNDLPERVAGEDDESAGMRYLLTKLAGSYNPPRVDEIIAVGHQLGALVVLAHPGRSKGIYAIPATEQDIATMVAAGLDGIEVFYPAHSPDQQAMYAAIAQKHHLLVTGGSDSHHPHQPLASWDAHACAAFLARFGIDLV